VLPVHPRRCSSAPTFEIVEHPSRNTLPVGEPGSHVVCGHDLVQIARRVPIAGSRVVVEAAAIEFDHHSEIHIAHVLVLRTPSHDPPLSLDLGRSARQPMAALEIQVSPFQHRTGARGKVAKELDQDDAARYAPPASERVLKLDDTRAARLDGVGEGAERRCDVGLRTGDVEHGVLEPDGRRRGVPSDPVVEVGDAMHDDTRRRDDRAVVGDGHVHRTLDVRTHHRLVRQRRGPAGEHGDPSLLGARERPGVVDIDTGVHPHQFPPSKQPTDLGAGHAELQQLAARDDSVLERSQLGNIHIVNVHRPRCTQPRDTSPVEEDHSRNAAVEPPSSMAGIPSLRWSQDRTLSTSRRTATRFLAMNSTNGFISSEYSPL
jgi:hypothetical protein